MTAQYEKRGIRFVYPENWKITEEVLDEWPRVVSVESPVGAFWSAHLYPASTRPDQIVDDVLTAMRGEYESLEAEPASESFGPYQAVGYDMYFYCLDLVISSHVRSTTFGNHTLLLLYQAEDNEFQKLKPVFRAMSLSILQNESD